MIKLIASDLDGTLLDDSGKISKENIAAIHKAQNKGIKFVIATGRSHAAAKSVLKNTDIQCPMICLNGAQTFDIYGDLKQNITINHALTKEAISACQKEDMYIEAFTNHGIYSTNKDYFTEMVGNFLRSSKPNISESDIDEFLDQRLQNEQVSFIHSFDDMFKKDDLHIYKVLSFSMNKDVLERVSGQLKQEGEFAITASGLVNIEINHKDAQKGIALKRLADEFGIDPRNIMALGDSLNDKSMLSIVGKGIAMANAEPEILELCKYKTKANIDHGVAHAIEKEL